MFDKENNNPVTDMIAFVIENYKGKPKLVTDEYDMKE